MKAFEVRRDSIEPQYKNVEKYIEMAKGYGKKSITITEYGAIYNEVAKKLAAHGFDVIIFKDGKGKEPYTEISWENAEEGKEGEISIIEESQDSSESGAEEIIQSLVGILGLK